MCSLNFSCVGVSKSPCINKPVRSFKIVFSAHAISSRISHLLLFNQEQKKVKTKEGEKFGRFLNYELAKFFALFDSYIAIKLNSFYWARFIQIYNVLNV